MGTATLRRLYALTGAVTDISPELDMSVHQLRLLLAIALNPGASMKTLQEMVGRTSSSLSRDIATLGAVHWQNKRPGFGLIRADEDRVDRRFKVVNLTEKGKRLVDSLSAIVDRNKGEG